ncbi:MAG: TIGR01458 family HAD-type hydrolase, partial [Gammaproteobacteria bacterium]
MSLESIQGILFDLSGVLYVGSKPIDGAIDALARVKRAGYPCRFITNTSTRSLESLFRSLVAMGLPVEQEEILSAPQAAKQYLREQKDPVCFLVLAEDVKQDFAEFDQSDTRADYVVVGDIGSAWNYALMNQIFKLLLDGARLIAIHKNRYWQTEDGLQMDLGGFIAALEYASSR